MNDLVYIDGGVFSVCVIPRSLPPYSASIVFRSYVGYDGSNRVNDFYEFKISTGTWSKVPATGTGPSPRDRHTGVVHGNSFFVLAGFDGTQRINDFFEFSFDTLAW